MSSGVTKSDKKKSFHIETDPLLCKVTGGVVLARDALEVIDCPNGLMFLSPVRSVIVRTTATACFFVLSGAAVVESIVRASLGLLVMAAGFIPLSDSFQEGYERFASNSFTAAKNGLKLSLANFFAIYFNIMEDRIQDVIIEEPSTV